MLRENRVKRAIQRGETVFGTMLQEMRTPSVAQVLASAGLDFMMMDLEHGAFSLESVADIGQMARLAGIIPLVRVPDYAYPWVARPLDAGIMGLMVPRIQCREHIAQVARAIKYPPVGERGCSVTGRQTEFGSAPVQDWLGWANNETLLIAQIEQKEAIENIDDILSVPGVDVALIGPNDLSISLGVPGQTTHPLMQQAIERVIESAEKHGVASGIHIRNLDIIKAWQAKGMRFLMYSTEIGFMKTAAQEAVKAIKGA